MKPVEFIHIAERKLQRRAIEKEWVIRTIEKPMQTLNGYSGRKIAQSKYVVDNKEYLLRVIYEETGHEYMVISAYMTSQVDRYWSK